MWSYQEAIDWLYGTQMFGIKLGLENTRRLLAAWDLSDPPFGAIHVAGTNGKGSVSAMIDQILRDAGVVTGLFTSPHLVVYEERIRVGGTRIARGDVAAGLAALKKLVESWETHPTFFELTFALAGQHFASSGVELAVIETGMGGRLDATNAILPLVSVITPVGLDHEQWLGSTLCEIAAEKAGIIKAGVPVVSSPQHPEVEAVLREVAESMNSPLRIIDAPYDGPVGLTGSHQRWNAALAVAAVEAIGWECVRLEHVRSGLAAVQWPARFQKAVWEGRRLVIDGAHNPAAARVLEDTWRAEFGETGRASVLFAAVESKDVEGVLRPLLALADRFVFVPLKSSRGVKPNLLMQSALRLGVPMDRLVCASSIEEGLAALPSGETSLVCGSLFLAGQVLDAIGKNGQSGQSEPAGFQGSLQ